MKDYFSWNPQKINVKFHKNCENAGKILKMLRKMSLGEIWHLFARTLIIYFFQLVLLRNYIIL